MSPISDANPHLSLSYEHHALETTPGPEAYRERKEFKPVFDHDITNVWGLLGPKVCDFLDSQQVTWTSIYVVRFAKVVLWIGVMPISLSGKDAHTAAVGCPSLSSLPTSKPNLENFESETKLRTRSFPGTQIARQTRQFFYLMPSSSKLHSKRHARVKSVIACPTQTWRTLATK
ncbi:hypothetical protein BDN72DRAFT_875362 [Pluteus cervinus]|uniref:Uncharacterized protein n=1 Tax=Pluteus cervinus TaxID=181527 RepID=A0ACD3B7V3_9AGAR|nr:hypothetical protein BDN72DRAFT_875362 [Pluteus cervinus]